MGVYNEDRWSLAFEEVKHQFNLTNILPHQEKSIREFFKGKNIFVNLPTGYGKSLIFQCIPIVADVLRCKYYGKYYGSNFATTLSHGRPSSVFV